MRWYIKRLDSLINPRCPRPYYAGYGPGWRSRVAIYWAEHQKDAVEFHTKVQAEYCAASNWKDWRERVRAVREREAR